MGEYSKARASPADDIWHCPCPLRKFKESSQPRVPVDVAVPAPRRARGTRSHDELVRVHPPQDRHGASPRLEKLSLAARRVPERPVRPWMVLFQGWVG